MGKSRTVTVTVSRKSSVLRIDVNKVSGTPGTIKISGKLKGPGIIEPIASGNIELWVNGSRSGKTTWTNILGDYSFNYVVESGSYTFQTKWYGNTTYDGDESPLVVGAYAKIDTDITIDVNPTFGAPPLAVTITGRLSRSDTTGGLGGLTVDLYKNNVKIKSMVTKTSTPLGIYQFGDTVSAAADYHVYFAGSTQFEGCEASDGATVPDGEPPDDEEPPTPPPTGIGAGVVLLALLVLSQE